MNIKCRAEGPIESQPSLRVCYYQSPLQAHADQPLQDLNEELSLYLVVMSC